MTGADFTVAQVRAAQARHGVASGVGILSRMDAPYLAIEPHVQALAQRVGREAAQQHLDALVREAATCPGAFDLPAQLHELARPPVPSAFMPVERRADARPHRNRATRRAAQKAARKRGRGACTNGVHASKMRQQLLPHNPPFGGLVDGVDRV